MTTQYTPILKLALPVTGELSGSWGDVVNDNITSMVEQAIAGLATINTWTANAHTLSVANGTTDEARCAMLVLTDSGVSLTGAATVTCPASSKIYIVKNTCGQAATIKTASGTGVTIPNGDTSFVFCDGTNVVQAVTRLEAADIDFAKLKGTGAVVVTNILDEDDMVSNSATALATQQSIKAYVDAQIGLHNGLPEILAVDNTTGGNNIAVSAGDDITFTDTSKAIFGTGGDLEIYHDGSNSYINDAGTGDLAIRSNGTSIRLYDSANAYDMVRMYTGGSVRLFNAGSQKLATTSTGVDITGGINATGAARLGVLNTDTSLTTYGTGSLTLSTNEGTNSGTISIAQGLNGNITLTPNGTGYVSVPTMLVSGGTANGVAYLNGSKVLTSGSALTFDGTNLTTTGGLFSGNARLGQSGTNDIAVVVGNTAGSGPQIRALTFNEGAYAPLTSLASFFAWNPAGTEAMRLTSTGLGIGTSSPTNTLTVAGDANITGNTTLGDASTDTVKVNGYMGVGGAGAANVALNVVNTALTSGTQYGVVANITGSSAAVSQINALYAGAKTAAASFTAGLVSGAYIANTTLGAGSTITNQHGVYIADQTNGTNNYGITSLVSSGTNKWNIYASGTAANYFAGNVGIGTSSPATKLDLYDATNPVYFQQTRGSVVQISGPTGTAVTSPGQIGTSSNSPFRFITNNTEVARFDTSGNLGLGVTPSAWSAAWRAFDNFGAGLGASTGGGQTILTQNAYNNGTNYIYKYAAPATAYHQIIGEHRWLTAPYGTAGTAISFTQAMTLDASGQLGIGLTSPEAPLQVSASTSVTNGITIPDGNKVLFAGAGVAGGVELYRFGRGGYSTNGSTNTTLVFQPGVGDNNYNAGWYIDTYRPNTTTGSGNYFAIGQVVRVASSPASLVERLRIDVSGNLGLGVTPSAWSSNYAAFDIGSAGAIWASKSSASGVYFQSNSYYTGTNYIYKNSLAAAKYEMVSGAHAWYTAPSGTAGTAISFTQAMTLTAGGNLLVGTTSDSGYKIATAVASSGTFQGAYTATNGADSDIIIGIKTNETRIFNTGSIASLTFGTNNTERARIDSSGNLLVGKATSSVLTAGSELTPSWVSCAANGPVGYFNRTASTGDVIRFFQAGTQVGSVSVTASTTSYITSSDYRLKNTIAPMTGALAKVAALKPCTYKWNADGSDGEGFIAHELQAVCPHAVTGEKDAVDADGNPVYQGIDTSFLVATLAAAIQEQQAIIDSLKARLDAANL